MQIGSYVLNDDLAVRSLLVRYSIIFGLKENRRMTDTAHTTDAPAAPKTMLDIADIQRILPHRYPFLLIDRVIEMTA
jgi:hypothetical protein